MKRLLAAVALLAISAAVCLAQDDAKANFLGVQVYTGSADLASEFGTGSAPAYDHPEYGFKFEYWGMRSEDYAFTASGGIGLFSEENKVGSNAPPGIGTFKYSQSSWNLRIGGDRVVQLSDRAYLFFGPGLEYWTGKAKFEDQSDPPVGYTYETESVTRFSLHGRIGAHMMIGESWGFTLQAGQRVGYASFEEAGAKSTWWPSSMDGSMGLVFRFGS